MKDNKYITSKTNSPFNCLEFSLDSNSIIIGGNHNELLFIDCKNLKL